MTLSYSQAKKVYQGDGTTTRWEIGFPFLQVQDLQIIRVAADGTETVLDGDFTVDTQLNEVCYPMSGSQTLPLAQGEKLILRRRTPLTQQMAFDVQQALDPSVLEAGYDKAAMIAQELAEELSRTVRFPLSSAGAQTDAQGYLNTLSQTQQAAVQANSSALQALAQAQQALTQLQTLAAQAASSAQLAQGKASEASASAQEASDDASAAAASAQTAAQHAQSISAHLQNTDNPHAVSKAQVGLGNVDNTADMDKPVSAATQAALDLKADAAEVNAALDLKADSAEVEEEVADINAALARKEDDDEFHPEDYNWPDIRPAARPNAIVLMAGVKADYSAYDNLGFVATCEGGYNVFIDGVQYGETYASGAQCSITWSQYSATAGFSVSYPEALTAHIIQIVPASAGNNISAFKFQKVLAGEAEINGLLWLHMNLSTSINLNECFSTAEGVNYSCEKVLAFTSLDNVVKATNIRGAFRNCKDLKYIPVLDFNNSAAVPTYRVFHDCNNLKKIRLKNGVSSGFSSFAVNSFALEKVECENFTFRTAGTNADLNFTNAYKLKELPQSMNLTDSTNCSNFVTKAAALKDTYLDFSYCHKVAVLGIYGDNNYPINGLKSLLVSAFAPFTGSAPQINVSYTGLDQAALVALFNSLPYNVGYSVVGSPTIQDGVASGFSANDLLSVSGKFAYSAVTEIVIKFRVNSSFLGSQKYANILSNPQLVVYGNTSDFSALFNIQGIGDIGLGKLTPDTDYWVKYLNDGTTVSSWISENGSSWTQKDSKDSIGLSTDIISRTLYFGGRYIGDTGRPAFDGSIDLAKSYIKISGVPYFRGTAAMDKTINITGATGAAALTAEQLAIATDKGWTVTR